jgi:hypothetical protein
MKSTKSPLRESRPPQLAFKSFLPKQKIPTKNGEDFSAAGGRTSASELMEDIYEMPY